MKRGRIGRLLETERLAQELEEDVLMEGIGTRRVLQKIEDNSQMCRKQTADVLLERLDRSPDKLEYIMGWQEYRVGCIWEWFMECVFRKNRKWAQRALLLCEEAINRLNRYSIEYFMRPLLEMALQCTSLLQGISENGWRPAAEMTFGARLFEEKREGARRYAEYLGVLSHLHEQFGEKWYPTDSVLYGCCQKAYHLDFEMIRAERYAHGMTQEMVEEGVYENAKEIAKIENRKSVPHEKRLRKLMQRFGLEKGRVKASSRRIRFARSSCKRNCRWQPAVCSMMK